MLFVPRGFFHGFLALEDDTVFVYDCDDYYDHGGEISMDPLDTSLSIDWSTPIDHEVSEYFMSPKDRAGQSYIEIASQSLFSYELLSPQIRADRV